MPADVRVPARDRRSDGVLFPATAGRRRAFRTRWGTSTCPRRELPPVAGAAVAKEFRMSATAEPFLGPLSGWRLFSLGQDGVLRPPFAGQYWPDHLRPADTWQPGLNYRALSASSRSRSSGCPGLVSTGRRRTLPSGDRHSEVPPTASRLMSAAAAPPRRPALPEPPEPVHRHRVVRQPLPAGRSACSAAACTESGSDLELVPDRLLLGSWSLPPLGLQGQQRAVKCTSRPDGSGVAGDAIAVPVESSAVARLASMDRRLACRTSAQFGALSRADRCQMVISRRCGDCSLGTPGTTLASGKAGPSTRGNYVPV